MRASRSVRPWPNRRGEKLDILAHAEVRIKVLAQALRHVCDARADSLAILGLGHISAENGHVAGLDTARARDQGQERRLADAIRPDKSDHTSARNVDTQVVERENARILVRDAFETSNRCSTDHRHDFACNLSGHAVFGSVRM